jgi:hypothetical protein
MATCFIVAHGQMGVNGIDPNWGPSPVKASVMPDNVKAGQRIALRETEAN